ncbi:helix-turn-helix domain-containing protein [Calidifontibacter sp. DB0510]|uniref:Helix-turn-helix domain-containing protein n=2 Tax=Metallococcus carri TaxID=1656884 RepID=A0A967B0J7_9MICO|nr:helix-turn-helix domain-containing protein [Metallococcus carri]NOP38503.1 helix-turn-helix domain-containing protein [Calidifontibacter sp. DB2511S]
MHTELTSAEACEALGVHPSTLSRWVQNGRIIPARKLPGLRGPFLFPPSEIKRLKAELARDARTAGRSRKAASA